MTENQKNNCFAENIQYLRTQNGWSQEKLAEQLSVSRQSVSKWESALALPEMGTLLILCDLFHTDLDTLLRGSVRQAKCEDAAGYDRFMNWFALLISGGVALILFGVGLTPLWDGIMLQKGWPQSLESIGAALLLLCILVAVTLFIVAGIREEQFRKKNPVLENFYTAEQKEAFSRRFVWLIAAPVAAILGAVVLLVALVEPLETLGLGVLGVAVFLWIIGGASSVLTWAGIQSDKYNIAKYNLHNTPAYKQREDLTGTICGGIMLTATAAYIALSTFSKDGWGSHWWVFAVGGILCAISAIIIEFIWARRMRANGTEDEALE